MSEINEATTISVATTNLPVEAVPPAPLDDLSDEMVLVARYPHEMQVCQKRLVEWAARKIAATQAEIDDLAENIEIARRNKWGQSALFRAHTRAVKMGEYYAKIHAALEQGYCIVPDFPVEVFAVRTKRKTASGPVVRWERNIESHQAEGVPIGAGQWVDNDPLVRTQTCTESDGKGGSRQVTMFIPSKLSTEIDFPFVLAKPEVLVATEQAMVAKVFDDLGVLPAARRKADPIVVGRIKHPRSTKYNQKYVTFMIAWFIDTATL